MAHMTDYIKEYGGYTFEEKPFNEVDNLIFSQLAYVDYAGIVAGFDSDVETSLPRAAELFWSLHSEDEMEDDLSIVRKAAYLLRECAEAKRFKGTTLLRYVNNVNTRIDKQFSAVNFYLDDGTALIAFRGTDSSLTGVKESAMLSYMFPVPAQIEALYYFQETASLSRRKVRVCGHSKGGNLAVFAAVSCSNSLKKNIIAVYEDDAPGFPKEMIERYDYLQMKDRIFSFVPEDSVIGCLLEHNSSTKIVKSENDGLKQHQASSWLVENDHFVYADGRDERSLFVEKYIKKLLQDVGPENIENVFETLFGFFEDAGITDYESLKDIDLTSLIRAFSSIKGITEEERKLIEQTLRLAFADFSRMIYKEKIASRIKKIDEILGRNED